jgi:hypothetical protein
METAGSAHMDQDGSNETGGVATASTEHPAGADPATEIDIVRLADKVYRLMREELRLERARGASIGRR